MSKSSTQPKMPIEDVEERKRLIAYQIWESEGRPEGKADEHWAKACLVVMTLADDETALPPDWLQRGDIVVDAAAKAPASQAVASIGKKAA